MILTKTKEPSLQYVGGFVDFVGVVGVVFVVGVIGFVDIGVISGGGSGGVCGGGGGGRGSGIVRRLSDGIKMVAAFLADWLKIWFLALFFVLKKTRVGAHL